MPVRIGLPGYPLSSWLFTEPFVALARVGRQLHQFLAGLAFPQVLLAAPAQTARDCSQYQNDHRQNPPARTGHQPPVSGR